MFKILSAKTIDRYYRMDSIIEEIEKAYVQYRNGVGEFPDRYFMPTLNEGDLLVGSAYLKESGYFSTISSSYTPANEGKNLPLINGVIVLFEAETGRIVAILDEPSITKLRTGAKSAVAVKHLSRPDSEVLGVLGMGDQARSHIEAISRVRDIKHVLVWSRNPKKHEYLLKFARSNLGLDIEVKDSPQEVARNADMLVHATWSKTPLVSAEDLKPGTFVIGLFHASDAVEFDADLLAKSEVFIDTKSALSSGTVSNAVNKAVLSEKDIVELGEVVTGDDYREMGANDYRYFQSVGAGIENLAGAIAVFEEVK